MSLAEQVRFEEPSEMPTEFGSCAGVPQAEDGEGTLAAGGASGAIALVRCTTGERTELALPAVLGRGSQSSVWLGGSRQVSREHLRIEEVRGRHLALDLGSRNGTLLNGLRIPAHRYIELIDGDVLRLADEEFVVAIG